MFTLHTSHKIVIGAALLFAWTGVALAQPNVTSRDETAFNHGSLSVIGGTGFGSKGSGGPPIAYDSFEGGTNGEILSLDATVGTWGKIEGTSEASKPRYHTGRSHAGGVSSLNQTHSASRYNSSVESYNDFETIYFDAWIWTVRPTGDYPHVAKLFLASYIDAGPPYPEAHFGTSENENPDAQFHWGSYRNDPGISPAANTFGAASLDGGWHHLQIEVQQSAGNDDLFWDGWKYIATGGDGVVSIWLDGAPRGGQTDAASRGVGEETFSFFSWGYYVGQVYEETYYYWDDVYLDNSLARVEIGNNPVYDSCSHREIQIPTNWSSQNITFTVNTGNMETATGTKDAWLFVTDSSGNVSDGYYVQLGTSGGGVVVGTHVGPTAPFTAAPGP